MMHGATNIKLSGSLPLVGCVFHRNKIHVMKYKVQQLRVISIWRLYCGTCSVWEMKQIASKIQKVWYVPVNW